MVPALLSCRDNFKSLRVQTDKVSERVWLKADSGVQSYCKQCDCCAGQTTRTYPSTLHYSVHLLHVGRGKKEMLVYHGVLVSPQ